MLILPRRIKTCTFGVHAAQSTWYFGGAQWLLPLSVHAELLQCKWNRYQDPMYMRLAQHDWGC